MYLRITQSATIANKIVMIKMQPGEGLHFNGGYSHAPHHGFEITNGTELTLQRLRETVKEHYIARGLGGSMMLHNHCYPAVQPDLPESEYVRTRNLVLYE